MPQVVASPPRCARGLGIAAAVIACSALVSCSSGPPAQELTVFAASSLRTPFTELAATFEEQHPGVVVRVNAAGSADLLAQLNEGAPADVFAPADLTTMRRAAAADLVQRPVRPFASNTMTIVVPPANPNGITEFADLSDPGLTVVVCAPVVPCGAATERVEQRTGVELAPASEETAVADVVAKVAGGEADAGVAYVTDVAESDSVVGVAIPARDNAVNRYSIAVTTADGTTDSALAEEFVSLVVGAQGRRVLADVGFGPP